MAKFFIHGESWETGDKQVFLYDTENSLLTYANGQLIDFSRFSEYVKKYNKKTKAFDKNHPLIGKNHAPSILKIQLGTKCNYSCSYCSQAYHVANSLNATPQKVNRLLQQIENYLDLSKCNRVEFWGGEPLVYWKSIKKIVLGIEKHYPNMQFLLITNGSLLNESINKFLDEHRFGVGISHDGPGQKLRGPDPFENEEQFKWIKDLYSRLSPKGRISFNVILNKDFYSRKLAYEFFKEKFDKNVVIGEGYFLYASNEGSYDLSLYDYQDMIQFRKKTFSELTELPREKVSILNKIVSNFISSIVSKRNIDTVGQRCGVDRYDTLIVDVDGNVVTCQNVAAKSNAFNGESHKIGCIVDLDSVKLNTGTHWMNRSSCVNCPVIHACGGMCLINEDKYWNASCDNSYNDLIPFFMLAIEILTGYIPYWIENPNMPEWRKDLLGMQYPNLTRQKKVIPIKEIK